MIVELWEVMGLFLQVVQEKDGIVIVKVEEEDEEDYMWGQDFILQDMFFLDLEIFC